MMEDYLIFIANLSQIGLKEEYPSTAVPFPWMSECHRHTTNSGKRSLTEILFVTNVTALVSIKPDGRYRHLGV